MIAETKKSVAIFGVPLGYGASMAGVDMGPSALRVARLNQRIARLGYSVEDLGDMRLERPRSFPEPDDKLKYVREISNACEQLAREVEAILVAGQEAPQVRRLTFLFQQPLRTEIEATAAATLAREERPQQTCESCEVPRLNQ